MCINQRNRYRQITVYSLSSSTATAAAAAAAAVSLGRVVRNDRISNE